MRLQRLFFGISLLLALLPVFAAPFLPTGDAPCHMHNSNLIIASLQEPTREYFSHFYFFSNELLPNWITNAIHIPLLITLGPVAAEKAFFLIYVLVFAFGLRFLLYQIRPQNADLLAGIGLLLLWAKPLWMGFTNNMFSVAVGLWLVGYYLKYQQDRKPIVYVGFFLLSLVLYFSHPVGYIFGFMGIGCFALGRALRLPKQDWPAYITHHLLLLLVSLPSFTMLWLFISKRMGGKHDESMLFSQKLEQLLKLKALVSLTSRERDLVQAFAIVVLLLLLIAFAQWLRNRAATIHLSGSVFWLIATLMLVFFGPASVAGGSDLVAVRLGFLPYLVALVLIASLTEISSGRYSFLIALSVVVITVGLLRERIPIIRNGSALVEEVVSCEPYIKPASTVLTLNYDYGGKTPEGTSIANQIWLFNHIGCYLGQYKPLVIADNYEANMWYFPLIAHDATNMYQQTAIDGVNFDHFPPRANILNYEKRTGQSLDYVLLINSPDQWANHEYTKEIETQLASGYTLIHTSAHHRAVLYQRNGLAK